MKNFHPKITKEMHFLFSQEPILLSLCLRCLMTTINNRGPACEQSGKVQSITSIPQHSGRRHTGVTSDLHSYAVQTHLPGARVVGLYRRRQLPTDTEFQCLSPRLKQTKRDAAGKLYRICAISRMSKSDLIVSFNKDQSCGLFILFMKST